jgi:hypothetical protein
VDLVKSKVRFLISDVFKITLLLKPDFQGLNSVFKL